MEIRREHKLLSRERREVEGLLKNEGLRWRRIEDELAAVRDKFGQGALGARRTVLGQVPLAIEVNADSLIEREPITVVLSDKGWIRAVKGHLAEGTELKFKEGDKLRLLVPCQTTDRLCLFASNGRAHTLRAGDLPRGRGDGQAIRVLAELGNDDDVAALFVWRDGLRYLVASSASRGFVVAAADLLAEKRTGKQVLNVKPDETALLCTPAEGDHVAVIGTNRKLLVFPLAEVPELSRGSGVLLQKHRDGKLADAKVFRLADGLTWRLGEKTRTETGLRDWTGARGQAGRMPPNGFPKTGKFS